MLQHGLSLPLYGCHSTNVLYLEEEDTILQPTKMAAEHHHFPQPTIDKFELFEYAKYASDQATVIRTKINQLNVFTNLNLILSQISSFILGLDILMAILQNHFRQHHRDYSGDCVLFVEH